MPRKNAPTRGRPFASIDARRGRGPAQGAENAGRPPSVIRNAMRESLGDRVALLGRIADGKVANASVGDRLRALEILARYALGSTVTATDSEGNDVQRRAVVLLPAIGV
jgi:hypothetical protein